MAHLSDLLVCLFMLAGAIFCLIASLGVFRMPDLYTRMQAAAKSSTLGVVCIILSVAIHFGDTGVTTRAMLVIVFLFLTAPVSAHMMAKAALSLAEDDPPPPPPGATSESVEEGEVMDEAATD